MEKGSVTVTLQARPDAYGFIYGTGWHGERMFSCNVMPPKSHWRGQYQLEGYRSHETDWVFYIEGREVARLRDQPDLEAEFTRLLLTQ